MKKTIDHNQFSSNFVRDAESCLAGLEFAQDGSIYHKGYYINIIGGDAACSMAYRFALAWKFGAGENMRDAARQMLDYADRSLLRHNGYVYWPTPGPSLCQQGRWARDAYHAAVMINDKEAIAWLEEMFLAWPYDKENHRFLERFTPVTHYPTSINGFLTTLNMVAEGAADAWLIASQTANPTLLERAKDTICNFILPEQLPSGFFNYHAKREVDSGLYNDGETEYNYNLYLVYILAQLLDLEDAREILLEPLKKSFDALYTAFQFEDGSIYTPVHWGWGHIFESTFLTAVISWKLYHWCGLPEYEAVCARAIHWLMVTDLGAGNHERLYVPGLYWSHLFQDILKDDFCVSADVADEEQIADTLQILERKLSRLPGSRNHIDSHFSLGDHKIWQAVQRKVNYMNSHASSTFTVPFAPKRATINMPWMYPQTAYSGSAELSFDHEALYIRVKTNCKDINQPYEAAELYQGDSVLLELNSPNGSGHCVVIMAQENGRPVLYKYNDRQIPFGGDLRVYRTSIPFGWYLEKSSLSLVAVDEGICYDAKLLWNELGVIPSAGDAFTGGISINRSTPLAVQYNQWGKTAMEVSDFSRKGTFIFDSEEVE